MSMPSLAILPALLLAAQTTAARPAAADPAPPSPLHADGTAGAPERDYDAPPPGSAADQALWQRAYDVDNQLPAARAASTRLQTRAKGYGVETRLRALAEAGSPDAAPLLARLLDRWRANVQVLTAAWPVDPTRVCRYDLLTLEGVMFAGSGSGAGQLDAARDALRGCLARADVVLARMTRANAELESAIDEAEKALAAGPPRAPEPAERACRGTLSGAVSASFDCVVHLRSPDDGAPVLEIETLGALDDVPGCVPGAFELPAPPAVGTYTLETLGAGRASVAAAGGTLYTATKTSSRRGEVSLALTGLGKRADGSAAVHGTYRARLLPAGAGKQGEVVVEVSF